MNIHQIKFAVVCAFLGFGLAALMARAGLLGEVCK